MPVGPTVRPAIVADAPAVAKCVEAAYRHHVARMGKPPGPMLADYACVIAQHDAYVAEHGDALVGVLVLVREAAGMLLDNVAVRPDYQGRGFGRRLIEHAERRAREQGYGHIDLYTHESMVENVELYRRLGYVEIDRRTQDDYARIYMRKAWE